MLGSIPIPIPIPFPSDGIVSGSEHGSVGRPHA
jgi:hypothetical protein